MIIANLAGISVFATGGVGGVHRGGEITMDISADLEELARTPVMVVCAGAKSILDLGLTLEYLETKGVAVVGYRTEELPAFYTRTSGFKLNSSLNSPKEIAQSFFIQNGLDYRMGMLVVNPIPEQNDMDGKNIENAIEYALKKAQKAGIRGKETTPFLLNEIKEITGGKSLEANIHLVYNNAELAARIACEYAALKKPNA